MFELGEKSTRMGAQGLLSKSTDPRLHLLGVSFRTAPVAVRESLSFGSEEARALLESFAKANEGMELMVLSTCNRTEFYLAADDGWSASKRLLESLRFLRPGASIFHSECQLYEKNGSDAAQHLFRVACGLDSAILGDGQILGQVKSAMRLAGKAGSLGSCLNTTLARTMRVAKLSRRETEIGRGNVGLGSAVAALLQEREIGLLESGSRSKTLIIGAGEIAREIGRHLSKDPNRELSFVNRSREKAELLAAHCGGRVEDWDALPRAMGEAHFVIAATSSPTPMITQELVSRFPNGRTRLYVDVGVPRNIEPLLGQEVLNVDSIRSYQKMALEARQSAIPQVEAMVEREKEAWERAERESPVEELIASLFRGAKELASTFPEGGESAAGSSESAAFRMMDDLLGRHARELRRLARCQEGGEGR